MKIKFRSDLVKSPSEDKKDSIGQERTWLSHQGGPWK